MRLVSTADLKNHTNEVLRTALAGEPVVVTRHGRPVASLLRLEEGGLDALVARGAASGSAHRQRAGSQTQETAAGRPAAAYGYAVFPVPFGTFYVAFGPDGPAFATIGASAAGFERDATRYLGVPVRRAPAPQWLADGVAAAMRRHEAFRGPVDLARVGPFEREVLAELRRIPAGQVRTYQQVALALGEPGAARAVGTACARNPLPLLIPCHRVVRSDGGLGGYSLRGGVALKRRLLRAEGAMPSLFE
jgi:methylated-DNA-[protein]-cysteine S-methyltransferase